MRITLKVKYKQVAIRHNLDLYNNESLDKLVRRCADRFALGTAYLFAAFNYLKCLRSRLESLKGSRIKLLEFINFKQLGDFY